MNSIQKTVYTELLKKGLPKNTICAIMGNITKESGWKVDAIEKGNNIGFGLCQWSFGRRKQLEAFGVDLHSQITFLFNELIGNQYINKKGYLTKVEFIAGNGTIEELTASFCFCFERPKVETAHLEERIESANKFYVEVESKDDKLFYPTCNSKHTSIINALSEIEVNSSYSNRKKIATANGISNYQGSYEQNVYLLRTLKSGKLKKV